MNTGSHWKPLALIGGFLLAGTFGFFIARYSAPTPEATSATVTAPVEATELKLDASYLASVGIVVEAVKPGNLTADVLAPATVTSAPNGEAVVTAHVAGTIVRLLKQSGDAVRAGETLALVESRDAATMAADQTVAKSRADLARSSLAREQDLYNQRVTPRQDLERAQSELAVAEAEVQRAREAADAAHVTADGRIAVASPIGGEITSATTALGTFVQPETELFRVTDPKFMQVEVAVTAMDAQRISEGDPASLTTQSGETMQASVRSVSPTVNEQTRATTVMLSLVGNHPELSTREILQAKITPKATTSSGVVVPEDAVQNIGGRNVVFVRTPAGFRIQPVVVGVRSAGRVSIASGLNEGMAIATANAFFLKAELGKGAGEE